MPEVFKAPGIKGSEKTVYLVPVGPKALFPLDKTDARKPREVASVIINNEPRTLVYSVSMREITDGTSNTVVVVEANPKREVTWTKPDDLEFDTEKPKAGLGGVYKGGFNALLVDGSVHFIPLTTDDEVLCNLFNPADGNEIPKGTLK